MYRVPTASPNPYVPTYDTSIRRGVSGFASSATPTAAAIDQGLNKSSGEGCPRGSRPFSN